METKMRAVRQILALGLIAMSVPFLPGRTAAAVTTYRVTMARYAYQPATLTVRAGDTVTWTNHDEAKHDVVTTSFRSPLLAKGASWSHTFTTPGTYAYYCSVHPDMRAHVVVRPVATTSAPAHHAPAPAASGQSGQGRHDEHSGGHARATPTATAATSPSSSTDPRGQPPATPSTSSTPAKTLNPLLLLAGLACAVTVFCLLLLTSPPAMTAGSAETESQVHTGSSDS
jgi:plastocyanin